METSVERRGDVIVVHVSGSVDGQTAEELQRVFTRAVEEGHYHLVGDFGGVEYTSSAGLRVLLGALKQTRARGGNLGVAALRPEVRKVLELSGFTSILGVFDTVDDAVRGLGGAG